jgi:hypothetical protein
MSFRDFVSCEAIRRFDIQCTLKMVSAVYTETEQLLYTTPSNPFDMKSALNRVTALNLASVM